MPSCSVLSNPTLWLLLASLAVNLFLVGRWPDTWKLSSAGSLRNRERPKQQQQQQQPPGQRIAIKEAFHAGDREVVPDPHEAPETHGFLKAPPAPVALAAAAAKLNTVAVLQKVIVPPAAPGPLVERRNGSSFLKPCHGGHSVEKKQIHAQGLVARRLYWAYLRREMSAAVKRPWTPSDPVMAPAYIHWSVEPTWTCNAMQRFGTLGDGGKVLCDAQTLLKSTGSASPPLIYSFGSRLQCDFERDIRKHFPTSEIHVFDPTPGVVEGYPGSECGQLTTFHGLGLGGDKKTLYLEGINNYPSRNVPLDNLLNIKKTLGHSQRVVDVLKIDIEGSEFDTFTYLAKNARAANWLPAKMIVLEVHLFDNLFGRGELDRWTDPLKAFQKLFSDFNAMGYRVYYKEINPYDARKCVEYALINKKYAT